MDDMKATEKLIANASAAVGAPVGSWGYVVRRGTGYPLIIRAQDLEDVANADRADAVATWGDRNVSPVFQTV